MANILVVDDEHGIRDLLWEILNDEGHNVELAENAAQARSARLRERRISCFLTSGCLTPMV
jgi:DNA-binding NtrC family response regulator